MKYFALGAICGVVAGCALPTTPASKVREASADEVVSCQRVGLVTGVPGVYGPLAKIGLRDARNAAKTVAYEQGANTVVFDVIPEGITVFEVTGTAYRC